MPRRQTNARTGTGATPTYATETLGGADDHQAQAHSIPGSRISDDGRRIRHCSSSGSAKSDFGRVPPPGESVWRRLTLRSGQQRMTATSHACESLARRRSTALLHRRRPSGPRTRPHHSCRSFIHQSSWPAFDHVARLWNPGPEDAKILGADQPLPSLARSPSPQPAETPKRQGRWRDKGA